MSIKTNVYEMKARTDYTKRTNWSEFKNNNIYLDMSFQRSGVWTENNKKSFIESVLSGQILTPLIIADIKKCIDNLDRNHENYEADLDYFTTHYNNGHHHISIDGNNRHSTLTEYFNGYYFIKDELTKGNKTLNFNKPFLLEQDWKIAGTVLPTSTKNWLEIKSEFPEIATKIEKEIAVFDINYVVSASREELNQIFINVNEGESLNNNHKRNAIPGKVSEKVREIANKYEDTFFRKSITEKKFPERIDHELISALLKYEEDNKFDKEHNTLYLFHKNNILSERSFQKVDEFFKLLSTTDIKQFRFKHVSDIYMIKKIFESDFSRQIKEEEIEKLIKKYLELFEIYKDKDEENNFIYKYKGQSITQLKSHQLYEDINGYFKMYYIDGLMEYTEEFIDKSQWKLKDLPEEMSKKMLEPLSIKELNDLIQKGSIIPSNNTEIKNEFANVELI